MLLVCAAEWLCESRWLSEVLCPDWVWSGSRIDLSAQAHGRWLLNSGGRDPSSTLFCTAHDHRHASHCGQWVGFRVLLVCGMIIIIVVRRIRLFLLMREIASVAAQFNLYQSPMLLQRRGHGWNFGVCVPCSYVLVDD